MDLPAAESGVTRYLFSRTLFANKKHTPRSAQNLLAIEIPNHVNSNRGIDQPLQIHSQPREKRAVLNNSQQPRVFPKHRLAR